MKRTPYEMVAMLTPSQHAKYRDMIAEGCSGTTGCERPVSMICSYGRGSEQNPKMSGIDFACEECAKEGWN